jgi:hypothetical protein
VHEVEAERQAEQLADEMRRRAGAAGGVMYLPGLALISATSSLTVRAGSDGWTVSTSGLTTAMLTGSKSLPAS